MAFDTAKENRSFYRPSFTVVGGTLIGVYTGINIIGLGLLLAHAVPSTMVFRILSFFSFLGPASLAVVLLAFWVVITKGRHSYLPLAACLAAIAALAFFNIACYADAAASV